MAKLHNKQTDVTVLLRSQHIFGRHSGSVNTLLSNPKASRLHASIAWDGLNWLLQDTSTNGTFINQKLIQSGLKTRLDKGDSIHFGALSSEQWIVEDISAPKSMLVDLNNQLPAIELEGIVVLPSHKDPEVTLYQSSEGDWICENHTGVVRLASGVQVRTKNSNWYFVNADLFESTKKAQPRQEQLINQVNASFQVSKNEEHVSLILEVGLQLIDLEERTHHYLLLLLARKKLSDQAQNIEESEQGWLDKDLLSRQMGVNENYINIQIFRFRKQLLQSIPAETHLLQMIERRRGELRIALNRIAITGGNLHTRL